MNRETRPITDRDIKTLARLKEGLRHKLGLPPKNQLLLKLR